MEIKGSKANKAPLDIPPDSPLGRILRFWGNSPKPRTKKKQKMIKYGCFIWLKHPILSFGPSLAQMNVGFAKL
jgi:hypothetical protein